MAWVSVGTAGPSGLSVAADQSSATFTVGAGGIAEREVAVLTIACDNFQTTDGDEGAVTGVTDTAGNTWTKAVEFCNGQGAAQAGCTISIWYSQITSALVSTNTIVAALSNSTARDATVIGCWRFSIELTSTVSVEGTATLANDSADPGSLDVTTDNAKYLRIRATAGETNSVVGYTPTSGWSNMSAGEDSRADSGTLLTSMIMVREYRISSETSFASNPSFTTGADFASAYVAFRETPSQATWHRHLSEPPPPRISLPANSQQANIYIPDLVSIAFSAALNGFRGWFVPLGEPVRIPPRLETGSQQFILPPNKPIIRRTLAVVGSHDGNPQLHGVHYPTSQIATKVHS